jgi:YbbR domain-containing protein
VVQIVRNNFALKLLALALAVIGWAYFRFAGNPIVGTPQNQQLSIPIAAVNLPLGYVARYLDREAVVTVEMKPGDPVIKPDEIKAVLDLSNKGSGVYNVPVQLVAPNLAIQSLSPASVTLTIEKIEQRAFSISLHYVGSRPSDMVVSYFSIGPAAAVVRAPMSLLAQISAVHADVALPNQPKDVDEMVRPIAVDSSGSELNGLSVTPNLVRVQMRVVAGSGAAR